MWEDPIVAYLVVAWRKKLEASPNKVEWMKWSRIMAGLVGKSWHLSWVERNTFKSDGQTTGIKRSREEENDQKDSKIRLTEQDLEQNYESKNFGIIADCQRLCAGINGWEPLEGTTYETETSRTTDRIISWLDNKWDLGPDPHHPIQWRPREWNRKADELANIAIQERTNWTQWYIQPQNFEWHRWNIRIFSDGGRKRKNGKGFGGTGWAILAFSEHKVIRLVEGGSYIDNKHIDSFGAEIKALDEAARVVDEFMRRTDSDTISIGNFESAGIDFKREPRDWVGAEWDGKVGADKKRKIQNLLNELV